MDDIDAIILLGVGGCEKNADTVGQPTGDSSAGAARPPIQSSAPVIADSSEPQVGRPSSRSVYYSVAEDESYGYEVASTAADQAAGMMGGKVIMVRYLGIKSGVYSFYWRDGATETLFTCKGTCEFGKTKTETAGYLNGDETFHIMAGSLAWEMLQDAKGGHLKPRPIQMALPSASVKVPASAPEYRRVVPRADVKASDPVAAEPDSGV